MDLPEDRLIFALDVPDREKALGLVADLSPVVGIFKVGLELFTSRGPGLVGEIREKNAPVFLDLKLFDIPKTVERTMGVLAGLGVRFATVHCAGGPDMLRAAVLGAGGKTGVVGVTVLTSQGGDPEEIRLLALERAAMARDAGCAGVVCSGHEAAGIKERFGADFITICPGIRPSGKAVQDQKRVMTPGRAISNGADFLVVGRPIRDAADPLEAAREIAGEIQAARA